MSGGGHLYTAYVRLCGALRISLKHTNVVLTRSRTPGRFIQRIQCGSLGLYPRREQALIMQLLPV
jgi:hypothetical protein